MQAQYEPGPYGNQQNHQNQQQNIPQGQPVGYPQQGYPPQGYPPQIYPQQGYPQQEQPPQGYGQSQIFVQQQFQGNGFVQGQYAQVPQFQMRAVMPLLEQGQIPSNANHLNFPAQLICPSCKQLGTTRMSIESGGFTFINCAAIAIISVCCSCIPFCIDDCKDRIHYCAHCGKIVGIKEYKACF